ncbi:restriction endonuclease subunit S [Faecalibacterium sp. I2-3-92]|uniref:restriction endonuclease subunit S n=1 Tax=Faecalibacterium sp. I2-3-92 TaxID=2929490 RepID=UPI002014D969|nr:restriction endonuclease subunit S [Faecalibacterium sp. I2-3-92]UQK47207.1 restriction endonuclease subunit S [Faecalibacterium sp. I2-3-92]
MKDSGIEWIGEIPEGWEVIPAKFLFKNSDMRRIANDEQLTASQQFGIISQKDYTELTGSKVVLANKGLEDWKHVKPFDFIISLRSFQGGLEMSEITGCITWHYIVLKSCHKICSYYYKWLFKSDSYIHALQRTCSFIRDGQDLRYSNFIQVPLFEPPLAEQEKIADYLNAECSHIDAMLSKTRSSIEEYKKLKQAVITQAVTKGVRGEREMKDSGVEWIGEIPAEWSICPLKRLAAIQTGSTPSKTSSESFYSSITGTPWIKPDNLGFSSSIETTAEFLTEEGCSVARTFPSNTVYVGCIGSRIGNCGYSLIPCACNQQINALIFNERMYWKYGWYLTIFQEEQYTLLANGNVIQIINSTTQGNISCIVPSISEQREITAYLDAKCAEIDGLIAKKEQLAKELESYKKSLIYEVVTGKREV